MALTLRLLLPECRLAHLKAPITTAGAYSKYPKDKHCRGTVIPNPYEFSVKAGAL
jgi:hypothetical protein